MMNVSTSKNDKMSIKLSYRQRFAKKGYLKFGILEK